MARASFQKIKLLKKKNIGIVAKDKIINIGNLL